MPTCFRIVQPAYAADPLSGQGPRLFGGRWNSPGHRCVYTASSRALAILEILCHLPPSARSLEYRLIEISVQDALLDPRPLTKPPHWDAMPASPAARLSGDDWLATAKHAAIAVPSVIVPQETNYLLNPSAPGFDRIKVIESCPFTLDSRLRA